MAIFDDLVKPALDSITTLIGQFHMSPEEKAQAQQAINDAAQKAQTAAQDFDVQLNTIAGQNIREETGSADKYTARARPTVIYAGVVFILWNWGLVPVIGAAWHLQPATIPDAFWWTWGTVVTGYVFSRGMEKIAAIPGNSEIKLPLGLGSISQKSN